MKSRQGRKKRWLKENFLEIRIPIGYLYDISRRKGELRQSRARQGEKRFGEAFRSSTSRRVRSSSRPRAIPTRVAGNGEFYAQRRKNLSLLSFSFPPFPFSSRSIGALRIELLTTGSPYSQCAATEIAWQLANMKWKFVSAMDLLIGSRVMLHRLDHMKCYKIPILGTGKLKIIMIHDNILKLQVNAF